MTAELEKRIEALEEENRELSEVLENERNLMRILKEKIEKSNRLYDEQTEEVTHLNSVVTEMHNDFVDIQKKYDK